MKRYKALIRYEFKQLLIPFAWFLVIDGTLLFYIFKSFQHNYESFLVFGEASIFNDLLRRAVTYWLIAHFAGVLIVTILSCRDHAKPNVQKFLQTLPVTLQKRYFIKTLCGVATYLVPYFLFAILLTGFSIFKLPLIREYALLSGGANLMQQFQSLPHLFFCLSCYLLVITFVFGVCQLFQYLTINPLLSVAMLTLLGVGPFYFSKIGINMAAPNSQIVHLSEKLSNLYEDILPWNILLPQQQSAPLMNGRFYFVYGHMPLKIFILLLLTALCFRGSYYLAQRYPFTDQQQIIPLKLIRYLIVAIVIIDMISLPFYFKYVFNAGGLAGTMPGMGLEIVAECLLIGVVWKKWLKEKKIW